MKGVALRALIRCAGVLVIAIRILRAATTQSEIRVIGTIAIRTQVRRAIVVIVAVCIRGALVAWLLRFHAGVALSGAGVIGITTAEFLAR